MNYVVIDSEKTGMILTTTNALLNELANFQIQLVIIEPNDTLDFEEISMKRFCVLSAAILAALSASLRAEDIAEQPTVQVTASRVAQSVDDTLADVSVITREDIDASASRTSSEGGLPWPGGRMNSTFTGLPLRSWSFMNARPAAATCASARRI